jgi:TRAP transporter TAXI family solute receptor
MISRKEIELAQLSTDVHYDCVRGIGKWVGKKTDIRMITPTMTYAIYVWTKVDSGINKPEDLRGHKVMWDTPTAPAILSAAKALLESVGLTRDDMVTMPISRMDEGTRALRDGICDAFIWAAVPTSPSTAYAEMDRLIKVKIIPLSEKSREHIVKKAPALIKTEIKGGMFKNAPNPIPTVAFAASLVSRPDMPESLIYEITKLIFGKEHRAEFEAIHPLTNYITLDVIPGVAGIALFHKGAVKFYKEVGIWTKELEEIQKKVAAETGFER